MKEMEDITSLVNIEASSRQAMVVCLTDDSMDTFWESIKEVQLQYIQCIKPMIFKKRWCFFYSSANFFE